MSTILRIYYFIIHVNNNTSIALVKAPDLDSAMDYIQKKMKENYQEHAYSASMVKSVEVNQFLTELGISTFQIAEPVATENVQATSDNYENLAKLLRDNGYSVKKQTKKSTS